jgi:hypothetical protein
MARKKNLVTNAARPDRLVRIYDNDSLTDPHAELIKVSDFADQINEDLEGGEVDGGYVAKTATYGMDPTDHTVDCTANSFTVTLPTAVGFEGRIYNIKNSGSGIITVATTDGQTVDGFASGGITLNQNDNLQVQSDGANYIIL